MPEIDFEPIGKRIEVTSGVTLLEAAQQAGFALSATCGGAGRCGQCRVEILTGRISPPTIDEKYILTEAELERGQRLACQTRVQSNAKVHVPPSSLLTAQRLQLAGEVRELTIDPIIDAYNLSLSPPTLHDPRSDLERLAAALPSTVNHPIYAEPAAIRQISSMVRTEAWQVTALLRDHEIVGVVPAGLPPVGVAIDVGTTKIAASLIDLETGQELAVTGALNPQIGYGEDVIGRLTYARRNPAGGRALAIAVQETLEHLIGVLIEDADVSRNQVADLCVVGNTAMTHLLLELPVHQLSVSPYVATTNMALDVRASDLGLTTAPGAYIHVLPGIGGFVGADHVAMMSASQIDQSDQVIIGIDIGTNTEIVLNRPDTGVMMSVSCASGPAFEGAHISNGMRAAAGAIEAVTLTDAGSELKTVEDAPAIGLCGSGIIDSVAELRRWRIINERGRFDRQHPRVQEGQHGPEFLLVPAAHSGNQRDVVVTQQDINEIQLAKGAIRAGLDVLLDATGTTPEDVRTVILAGAFGSFLNVRNALAIGLLPRLPNAHYRQVGNAALSGAKWALLSRSVREQARQIAAQTRYLELSTHPKFQRYFASGMLLPDDEVRI